MPPTPFPSPLGEMGLSICEGRFYSYRRLHQFPSPLGEMGLSILLAAFKRKQKARVSVPSRGNGVIDR